MRKAARTTDRLSDLFGDASPEDAVDPDTTLDQVVERINARRAERGEPAWGE